MSSKLKSSQIKTPTFSNILTGADNVQTALTTLDTHVQPVALGGTNITSYTAGDILYANGATSLAKLPKGSNGQILAIQSNNLVWQDASFSTLFDGYYNKVETGTILDGYYNSTEVTNLLSGYVENSDWMTFNDSFTRIDDGYFVTTNTSQNLEIFKQGRLIKFQDSTTLEPTFWAYNIVDSVAEVGNNIEVYISGNPLDISYDVMQYTMTIEPKEVVLYFDGYFAQTTTNDLLLDYKRKYWNKTFENNHIVKFEASQYFNDTGANQPYLNINSCCTLNSSTGIELSDLTIATSGANLDYYYSQFKDNFYVNIQQSSNGDADTLSLKVIYVQGPEKLAPG